MRVGLLVVVLVLPLLAEVPPPSGASQLPEGASLDIVIQDVRGEADVCFDPRSSWGPAVKGMAVPVGSQFCTGAGASVWLAFGTNSVALVREGSLFRIDGFGMEGDELVARVHIDPGIASVSVVQRQQFLTDFKVSTPRLTASIRGSGETVVANGDEVADRVLVDEHFAEIVNRNGLVLGVREGGSTTSNGETPHDLATRENVADVVPNGATDRETSNVEALSSTSQSTDNLGSNLTFSPTSNPVAGPDGPSPEALLEPFGLVYDPGADQKPDQLHELGHFILQIGDIETDLSNDREEFGWRWEQGYMQVLSDGQNYQGDGTYVPPPYEPPQGTEVPSDWNPEGEWSEANHDRMHDMGVRSFIDDYLLPNIERDAHHDGDQHWGEVMDQETRDQRIAEFHQDAYGEGFDRFAADLRAAADAAELGELEREALGRILLDVAHMSWHMGEVGHMDPEGMTHEEKHALIHEEYMQPLLDRLAGGPFEEFVDAMLELERERWHGDTQVDTPEPGTREAERLDHFEGHLEEMRDTLLPPEGGEVAPPDPQDLPAQPAGGEDTPPQAD